MKTLDVLFVLFVVGVMTGCGNFKRMVAGVTGDPTEYCYKGVTYLQFPSGAVAAIGQTGSPLRCE